jgi:hypothetical protein
MESSSVHQCRIGEHRRLTVNESLGKYGLRIELQVDDFYSFRDVLAK